MLDQMVINLLSTLLGGLLTILGGLAAQKLNTSSEKMKIRRDKIEEIYTLLQSIEEDLANIMKAIGLAIRTKDKTLIPTHEDRLNLYLERSIKWAKMEMLSALYITELEHSIHKCQKEVENRTTEFEIFMSKLEKGIHNPSVDEIEDQFNKAEEAINSTKIKLTTIMKKRRYV